LRPRLCGKNVSMASARPPRQVLVDLTLAQKLHIVAKF
jgi:hypothetical protein